MKFSIKDFSSKSDQICRKLRIWSRLLEKYLWKISFFCVVLLYFGAPFACYFQVVMYFLLPHFYIWLIKKFDLQTILRKDILLQSSRGQTLIA